MRKEVLAEMPFAYKLGYILVAGCDNPDVHFDLASITNASDVVVLKRAKFYLKIS